MNTNLTPRTTACRRVTSALHTLAGELEMQNVALRTKHERAMKAVALAESVMDYCQGDSWERECTKGQRAEFETIMEELKKP